ncbi:MAG: Rad52/Rad22 family DNA repair protein [Clostridium sp.]
MNELINNNARELENALKKPFELHEIEWRVGSSFERNGEVKALALPYVTSRAIMDRLDEVFGLDGWSDEYKPWGNSAQLCGITVRIGDREITKWDGADSSDIEAVKGGLSNALKRTAVKFGIGRYLYSFDPIWVRCDVKGKNKYIAKEEFDTTIANFYKKQITKIFGTVPGNNYSNQNQAQVKETRVNYNSSNNPNNQNQGQFNKSSDVKPKQQDVFNAPNIAKKVEVQQVNNSNVAPSNDMFNSPTEQPKVPGALLNFIKSRINSTGKNINSIIDFYKVASLEALSMEQANDLVARLG